MAKKIKITKKEVIQMIKEEYNKKKTEIALKKRLNEVNSKINSILKESGLQEDEETIEEVQAGGEEKVRSTAWSGEKNGDTKFKPEFDIKGTHKLEEEEEISDDVEEIPMEMDNEEDNEDIEEILRKLADAIEDKVEDVVDEKFNEENADENAEAEENLEDASEDNEDDEEEGTEEPLEENAEEPQSGHSPATEESKDAPSEKTPFTEKQNMINEANAKKQTILSEEKKRMQIMAGIRKADDVI